MSRYNIEFATAMGKRMQECRKKLGLTQENIADAANITHQQYNKAERGKCCLGSDTLRRVAQALHTSADYLLFGNSKTDRYQDTILILDKMSDKQIRMANAILWCVLDHCEQ